MNYKITPNLDVAEALIDIAIPENKWLSQQTRKYRDLQFSLLSKFLIYDDLGNTLLQITGNNKILKQCLDDLNKIMESQQYQILHYDAEILIINIKFRDPWILNALVRTELLLNYPLKIQNGVIEIHTIALRNKIDEFLLELENHEILFTIRKIGQYNSKPLLTAKQTKILRLVEDSGYYHIPRQKNLTQIAKELNKSPSALSENLRRIHGKLANEYLDSGTLR